MFTITEDAADARHDTPYVPPAPCTEKLRTPRLACNVGGHVHKCVNPRATHFTLCVCGCGFRWDISATIPTNG